ncbi:phytoene/squalene synthase family protein [Consotaella salsifontis]|uniref:Phytoene synthase n=1 Tax=Consotaella salsifontis TaxID=1365950 RepID=A0A1T4R3Y1_9HYPH|nr:phytoene/squalene synthase family protein [Consotaella salsifontis]SKA10740.1 phytoene synthase [Consotaella salsifontis]
MTADFQPSTDLVRDEDPDRALSTLFAIVEKRDSLNALYAFNIETGRVRDRVSQPLPGEIRLQWWRDTVVGAAGEAGEGGAGNPYAEALVETIKRHDLPLDAFDRFLEARIFDLYDDPMPERSAFEAYAGETASALIMLAVMVLDRDEAAKSAEAAGHAGVAQLTAGVLQLLPLHRSRGQIFIPGDILDAAGCSPQALLAGEAEPTARAVAAMTAFGREHLAKAKSAFASLPRSIRPAFLAPMLSGLILDRISRHGLPGDGRVEAGTFRRLWEYWTAMRR